MHLETERIAKLMLLHIIVTKFWTTYKINNKTNRW